MRTLTLVVALASRLALAQESPADPSVTHDGDTPSTTPAPPPSAPPKARKAPPSAPSAPSAPPEPQKAPPPPAPQPAAPSTAAAVGVAFPEQLINRHLPYGLRITLNGYFRAPLRIAWRDRGMTMPGEASTNIRAPWLVDDDYFRSGFAYTRLQEQDWTELYLGVGNQYLSGTVALMGSLYSDWARPLIDRQWGIAQGWLTFRWQRQWERIAWRLQLKGGAFWDRFGYLPYYDTYLVGRTHQLGIQQRHELDFGKVSVVLTHGFGAHLDLIDANQGFTLLNYVALGARWRELEGNFYFLDATTQDKRQLKELTDANTRVYGLDLRLKTQRFGRVYAGGSLIFSNAATFQAPAIEVMHAFGGRGLAENYFGTDQSENGTGRLYNFAFEHKYSVADLLRVSGRQHLHRLRGGDVTLAWFGVYTYVLSKQISEDPAVNRNMRGYFKWGGEAAWSALSWLAVSLRYDRVILDMNDDANSFRILTPRVTLRTHWLVDAELYIQYSRYFYGPRVTLRPGQVALETMPDTDVFKVQAQIVF